MSKINIDELNDVFVNYYLKDSEKKLRLYFRPLARTRSFVLFGDGHNYWLYWTKNGDGGIVTDDESITYNIPSMFERLYKYYERTVEKTDENK